MKKEFVKADIETLEIKLTTKNGSGETCPYCGKVWTGASGNSAHKGNCPLAKGGSSDNPS